MKKVVMIVMIVGLGFAGLQSKHYYLARVIKNVLNSNEINEYNLRLNDIKTRETNLKKDQDKFTKDSSGACNEFCAGLHYVNGTGRDVYYDPTNKKCNCWNYDEVAPGEYKNQMVPTEYAPRYNVTESPEDLEKSYNSLQTDSSELKALQAKNATICDVPCNGIGDPGHNIYDATKNHCLCRRK